jgi:hypothetical protein
MNNTDVQRILDESNAELLNVQVIIGGLGIASNITPYLTRYAVIKACGTIEQSFKTVIADFGVKRSKKQVKQFIDRKVRENSANPSFSNICSLLSAFDGNWSATFKANVKGLPNSAQMLTSLQSLVDARNSFAHGGNPTATINDVITYYHDARSIIEQLDLVVV